MGCEINQQYGFMIASGCGTSFSELKKAISHFGREVKGVHQDFADDERQIFRGHSFANFKESQYENVLIQPCQFPRNSLGDRTRTGQIDTLRAVGVELQKLVVECKVVLISPNTEIIAQIVPYAFTCMAALRGG
jgi:hypothetical protein